MATNYEIDYNDDRFKDVEAAKTEAINEVDKTYGDMIGTSDQFFNSQIQASQDWANPQTKLQNEKTDFAIDKIEQEKAQAQKDYTKEQSGAYVDWQKQSNQYGANAEQVAAGGLANTGFAESSQVSMYNTYQNRVATARESYNQAVMNYNNAITEARLQNNSILAEIAHTALEQQLTLALEGFQYKNQLILDQTSTKLALDSEYYNRYKDVLNQINTENTLAEEVRQFNAGLDEEKRQFNILHPSTLSKPSSVGGNKGTYESSSQSTKPSQIIKPIAKGKSKTTNSSVRLDEKSVLSLGEGPLSGEAVANRVKSGAAVATQKGNTITVKKANGGNTKKMLYSKYRF